MEDDTTSDARANGYTTALHQPQARKPIDARLTRALGEDVQFLAATASGLSSERTTPAPPEDAPLSVKATSAARQENRRKAKQQRMFPSIDFQERLSYFDPKSSYSNFRGFFVLFWIGLAIMVITTMLRSLKETGTVLNFKQWPLFVRNMDELGLSDALMCASTAVSLSLNKAFVKNGGIMRWNKTGMVLQSLYQAGWLWFWVAWPFLRNWTWTAQVGQVLHADWCNDAIAKTS
jgi:sterol O-acyltransferase